MSRFSYLGKMESLHPDLWSEIFSDSLYIIQEELTAITTAAKETPVPAVPEKVIPATPAAEIPPAIATPSISAIKEKIAPAEVKAPVAAVPLKPEGAFTNGVLILMHASQSMTASQKEMLGKIVKAVQLELSECGLLSLSGPIDLKKVEELKPRFILSFGLPADTFNPELTKKYYEIQKYNSLFILSSDSLGNLEKTDTLKRNLWNALKEMFGMK